MEAMYEVRRDVLRAEIDEHMGRLSEAMQADDQKEAECSMSVLRERIETLAQLDHEIQRLMSQRETPMTREAMVEEFANAERVQSKFFGLRKAFELYMLSSVGVTSPPDRVSQSHYREKGRMRLPKIELKEFDGDVKNWLGFWSQFKHVHEDEDLSPIHKFSYLRQAMVPGSPAAELVNSYVPTEASYPKVVQHVKSRFARDGMLIDTYMRELLSLVMQNHSGKEVELRVLYDRLVTQLRSLEALGIASNKYAAMLKPLVESAIPDDVLQAWQRSRGNVSVGEDEENREGEELEILLKFLAREVEGEQQRKLAREAFGDIGGKSTPYTAASLHAGDRDKKTDKKMGSSSVVTSGKSAHKDARTSCIWCERGHPSNECIKVRSWALAERLDFLQKKRACFTCLKVGHRSTECKAIIRCLLCPGRHYTMMCSQLGKATEKRPQTSTANAAIPVGQSEAPTTQSSEEGGTVLLAQEAGPTLLQTLQVKLVHQGDETVVRVLLDTGSQRSYVRKKLAGDLKLEVVGSESLSHSLFGGAETRVKRHSKYKIILKGLDTPAQFKFSALDEEEICRHVPRLVDPQIIQRLAKAHIILSDTGPDPPPVDILLGADVIGSLMTGLTMDLGNKLVAFETMLGWTVMGPTYRNRARSSVIGLANLNFELQDLWRAETLGIRDGDEVDDATSRKVEMHRLLDIHVNEEGRYEVALPWKGQTPRLVCNRLAAEKRLMSATRNLEQSRKFTDYGKVFEEWLELDIIERVPEHEDKHEGFYLPHRAVIKESSQTTKIRPVFDASAKDYNGLSLNSGLEKGPNLIEDILKLLLQFRKGAIGVTADIAKAFLQISILPEHRKYLKFLWWENDDKKKMIEFRHKRVVFGVTSSPFLLNATIEYHLDQAPREFKEIAERLRGTFYMDNVVTSVESREQLLAFAKQANELMLLGKFELRQWASGPELIEPITSPDPISILGVHWDRIEDKLFVNRNPTVDLGEEITRRALLSIVHAYFDPIGLICPYTLLPRLMLQEAWSEKGDWDDNLAPAVQGRVIAWCHGAELIPECRIERRLTVEPWSPEKVSLHVFCDASQRAYATCIFAREVTDGSVRVRLVQAKARVAPRKPNLSTPRLELMAALIGVRLWDGIRRTLGPQLPTATYFWSDSRVALTWIKGGKEWSVFVRNRCAEIKRISTPAQWFHVPGALNPADLPSRGCAAKVLLDSRWWEGPEWLRREEDKWPTGSVEPEEGDVCEINKEIIKNKANILIQIDHTEECGVPIRSQFVRILTTVARMMRWRTKRRGDRSGEFTSEELKDAEKRVFQAVQKTHFGVGSKFTKEMETFYDDEGYLRLKTRLAFTEESDDFKNPILLPGGSNVVQAFVREQHFALRHVGLRTMISALRERYWITDIRRVIKRVMKGCKECKRQSTRSLETPPAPLPKDRVHPEAVFQVTGIDYAGPLYLKGGEKAWIVLFTCAVYRAVHLELVTTLSTQGFFQAFHRFMARRGRPSTVWTDNGTQFTGAAHALKSINWETLVTDAGTRPIEWKFIPPKEPWWGGFWERMVGMVKNLLRRNLGRATLTYQELSTVLCDIEAIINRRPLTYNSIDEPPITPARYLQGIQAAGVQDIDQLVQAGLNSRLKYLHKLREGLRERFRSEYLALLVNKQKKQSRILMIRPGDVVLIATDSKARLDWPLGLVLEVKPGADGHGRVARLRVAGNKELERPLRRLFPFEVREEMAKPEEVPKLEQLPKPEEEPPKKEEEEGQMSAASSGIVLRSGKKLKC